MIYQKITKLFLLSVLLIVLTFGLTSCGVTTGDGRTNENYRVGSQGLDIRIAPGLPPSQIYDEEDLNVLVELYNRGATDIQGGNDRIYLSGFDTSIINGIPSNGEIIDFLEGKSIFNDDGGYTVIDFNGFIRDLGSRFIDRYDINLMVTACYNYETIASPNVCIDPDPFSRTIEDKVCNFNSVKMSSSQGAPVAVSSVQVEAMPGKTRFKIYISNIGGGTVFKEDYYTLDKCNPYHSDGLEREDINFVRVEEVEIGGTSILSSCKPLEAGYLRIRDGSSGYMVCEIEGLSGPTYNTPLRIKLDYGYRDTLNRYVEILQSNI